MRLSRMWRQPRPAIFPSEIIRKYSLDLILVILTRSPSSLVIAIGSIPKRTVFFVHIYLFIFKKIMVKFWNSKVLR